LVGGVESKPAPFKNRKGAAPNYQSRVDDRYWDAKSPLGVAGSTASKIL
jgi:hypothetical protein